MAEINNSKTNRIAWPTRQGFIFCDPHDVTLCRADGSYTLVYLQDGTQLTISYRLKTVETLLGGLPFFRIHDSSVVNLAYARELRRDNGIFSLLVGSFETPVAKSRRKTLLQAFRTLHEVK